MKMQPFALLTDLFRERRASAGASRLGVAALSLFALLLSGAGPDASAASPTPPDAMTYQGFLVDANGNPLGQAAPQNYPVAFRIYSTPSGGAAPLWAEQQIVTVDKGTFSVMLGEGTPIGGEAHPLLSSVFTGATASDRYVSVWVTIGANTTEILPRLRLVPSPYSFLATGAARLVQPDGSPVVSYDGGQVNITGSMTASGVINGNGSGLTALNASQMASGTLADARLSANVALRAGGNAFTGNQTVSGASVGLRVTDGTTNGNIVLQPLGGGNSGYHAINFNGYHDGSEQRFSTSKSRWRIVVDQRSTSDIFAIDTFPGPIALAITTNGNLGIGTLTPMAPLSMGVGLANTKVALWDNGAGGSFGLGIQPGVFRFHVNQGSDRFSFFDNAASATERVTITGGGRVGIGIAAPTCPLDVRGFGTLNRVFSFYSKGATTAFTGNAGGDVNYSILAEHRIGAAEFNAFSDARIKRVVGPSDTSADLKTIEKLRVTDYRSVDQVALGAGLKKGFIAQEVQKVIPEAVTAGKNFVPDIFALASNVSFNAEAKTLAVTLGKAHALRVGERVRLLNETEAQELTIVEVPADNQFVVGQVARAPKQVFVYGREVPDFLTVNYDRIFTTGIGAIQELASKVQQLQLRQEQVARLEEKAARVDALEQEMAALKKDLANQQRTNAGWEARFSALEKVLATHRTPALQDSTPTVAAVQ